MKKKTVVAMIATVFAVASLGMGQNTAQAACGATSPSVQTSGSYISNYQTCYAPSGPRQARIWASNFVNLRGWQNIAARRAADCTGSIVVNFSTTIYNVDTGNSFGRQLLGPSVYTCTRTIPYSVSHPEYITAARCYLCT